MSSSRSSRSTRSSVLAGMLPLTCLLAVAAHAATAEFKVTPDTMRADETGVWLATLLLQNHGEWGLYPDSLFMDWLSGDPDSNMAPRRGTRSLAGLVKVMEPAAGGESASFNWSAPADFETGRLTFRLYVHDAQKHNYPLATDVVVVGSLLSDLHPSRMIGTADRAVELVVVPADSSAWPAPGVLVVPAPGTTARSMLRWALRLAQRGYSVGIVSLPGSGRSAGSDDRSGPASVTAVDAALARFAHEPGVDPRRIALWGMQAGAGSALLAAVKHPELAGIVAEDAHYDPWAAYRALPEAERAAFLQATGRDSAAWRARSPLAVATRITAPVLVLQSDEVAAPTTTAVEAFAALRAEKHLFIETRIHGAEARPFRHRDATRLTFDFLARRLRKP